MANNLFRKSKHPLVRWWWSIDRPLFYMLLGLMVFGGLFMASASGSVAGTYNIDPYYFAKRQWLFLAVGFAGMMFLTTLSPTMLKKLGILMLVCSIVGVILTFLGGESVKGAQRWINLGFFKLQPSEFLKPALIIITAWLMSSSKPDERLRGFYISIALLFLVSGLLFQQPDFGMTVMLVMIWFVQVFLAGIPIRIFLPMLLLPAFVLPLGYVLLDHVKQRFDRFFDPASGDSYQVDKAYEAFMSGGMWGRGIGEGVVKNTLPDAHTDFIFSVIGEELGLAACVMILTLYAAIVARAFTRMMQFDDRFTLTAIGGILAVLTLQVLVNIMVTLNLLPTTGMTLPFISYGGSATMTFAILMGLLMALLRKREKGRNFG